MAGFCEARGLGRYSPLSRMRANTSTGKTITISHAPSVNLTTANSSTTSAVYTPPAMLITSRRRQPGSLVLR